MVVNGPGDGGASSSGGLVPSGLGVLEQLGGEVADGQRAGNADGRADLDNG